ncbi:hypothetical protein Zm00014a_016683 [Zea mays]|nr:hypothetical protein Zm00014a_016683 [Zea mays]
MFGSFSK